MGINIVVGLWFTPYLIGHLGIALYGVVILANSVTNYMSIVNGAIGSVTGRYLTIELQQGETENANRIFNTAFWSSMIFIAGLLPIVLLIANYAPYLFDVPADADESTKWLFFATLFGYLFVIVKGVFGASTVASNRLDIQNFVTSTNVLIRIAVIVLFFGLTAQPALWHVGAGVLIAGLLSFGLSVVVWRWLTPELMIAIKLFDRKMLRNLSGMSGWVVINQLGSLLFLNIDLIVINVMLGAAAGGRYGSALQWTILLRTLGATVATALTPIVLRQYARGDLAKMTELAQRSVKWMGLAFALPVGLITTLAVPLMSLWLGPEFAGMAPVLQILVIHLCVNLAVLPLFSLQVAMNKVRGPGIVTLGMGIVNLLLALWWARWGNNGLGVALAGAFVLTLKNTVYIPIYGAYIQKLSWHVYLLKMIPGILATIGICCITYLGLQIITIQSWFVLLQYTGAISLFYTILVYWLGLDHYDRILLIGVFRTRK